MAPHTVSLLIFTSLCFSIFCVGEYTVPDIKFEAFQPSGLRVSLPAEKGVELFAFHGNVNREIQEIEPGELTGDVTNPTQGRFIYINRNKTLKEGDVIHYWVYVQHELLGYRRDEKTWTVEKLLPQSDLDRSPEDTCKRTISKVEGKKALCSGDFIINYNFTEAVLDPKVWIIQQYYPQGPDFEYVIYKNEPDVIGVDDNVLRIQPKVVEENANKSLNIEGCTRPPCQQEFKGFLYPPIVSGQIVSKDAFCFGEIKVRAKLPKGDWIFPEMYLQDVNDPERRILLAFARGNRVLKDDKDTEIGGRLLYGGPYASPNITKGRNSYLAKKLLEQHVGEDWHVFSVTWTNDQMNVLIDNQNYGFISASDLASTGFNKETMVRLVLGVGVGGQHDFPEDSVSGTDPETYRKPWYSLGRNPIRALLNARKSWENTWKADNKLLVESVTVTAI